VVDHDAEIAMTTWGRALLIISGLVPLLGLLNRPPDTTLLIYSTFVVACLARRHLARWADRLPGPAALQLLASFWVAGSLTELFAWMSNYFRSAAEPALLHPQLIADLILGLGFYAGWAVAWLLAMRWFRFSLAETFLITGFQGIFFEQLGAVFIAMLRALPTNPGLSILMGVYVLAVHGSAVGLAMVPVLHRFDAPTNSRHPARFLVAMALMVPLAVAGTWLAGALALVAGGLPPKRSIVEHPYW
jgi:hypothetical protein